jgi:hypothetical protein
MYVVSMSTLSSSSSSSSEHCKNVHVLLTCHGTLMPHLLCNRIASDGCVTVVVAVLMSTMNAAGFLLLTWLWSDPSLLLLLLPRPCAGPELP